MYTYQVLQRIPNFVPLFGTLLGGIYWITHRREEVAEAEHQEKKGGGAMTLRDIPKMRFTFWKAVFLLIMAAGVYCTYLRFFQGLGASTNLSDQFPWGLWIGFDVMCGVMLAAGGFTLTAAVQIFNIKRWHSDHAADHPDRFHGLPAGLRRAYVRPWSAVEHLASAHHAQSALGDVRGGLLRDALHRSAGAGVLAHRL